MRDTEPAPDSSPESPAPEVTRHEVTRILQALDPDDPKSTEALIPLVYNELRNLAARRLSRERTAQTLQATALVHEAYLRLLVPGDQNWANRRHFFSAAAEAMRRILIESARRKRAIKRGGELQRSEIDVDAIPFSPTTVDILDLSEAVDNLDRIDHEAAELVKLRYFAGLTMAQISEILGVSLRTAESIWTFARTWLFEELSESN